MDVEHLLLAILREQEGIASDILAQFSIDYEIVRDEMEFSPETGAKELESGKNLNAFDCGNLFNL